MIGRTVRLTEEDQNAIKDAISGAEAGLNDAKDKLSEADDVLNDALEKEKEAKGDGDSEEIQKAKKEVEKAKSEVSDAHIEVKKAELVLRDELRKATIDQRKIFSERIAKQVEEAFKAFQDNKTPTKSVKCKDDLDALSPGDVFLTAAFGSGIGKCKVEIFPGDHPLCYLYVKSGAITDSFMQNGFPQQTLPDGSVAGSGCVFGNDDPKPFEGTACQYRLHSYNLAEDDIWRICSKFTFGNVYSQLLLAVRSNACGLGC